MFANDVFKALQDMQLGSGRSNKDKIFIQRYFNVKGNMANPIGAYDSTDALSTLVNALIEALNESTYLPKYIIVIPDWDILRFIKHYDSGITVMTGKIINWLTNQMIRAVDTRRDDLMRAHHGAVAPGEPKFVWVKMFNQVNALGDIFVVCNCYNRAMEDIIAAKKAHFTIDVNNALQDAVYFTRLNELNDDGKHRFWLEVNDKLQQLDEQEQDSDVQASVSMSLTAAAAENMGNYYNQHGHAHSYGYQGGRHSWHRSCGFHRGSHSRGRSSRHKWFNKNYEQKYF